MSELRKAGSRDAGTDQVSDDRDSLCARLAAAAGRSTSPRPTAALSKSDESAAGCEVFGREFAFGNRDFERVRTLIYRHAGIALTPLKHDMVYSRLSRRLRALHMASFSDYLDMLESSRSHPEWESFVNALTTNLTSFFREAHHFDILAAHISSISERRPIKIWCCAASTGEEAYSIAITASEIKGASVQILASDLDTNVLSQGQRGFYKLDRLERLDPARVQRHFSFSTSAEGVEGYQVRPELQRMISFKRINLLEANWPVQAGFDAIFCRNVMIYFDRDTQTRILERFAPLLRPDGLLFAGHSENFVHASHVFRSLGRTVYARTDAGKKP